MPFWTYPPARQRLTPFISMTAKATSVQGVAFAYAKTLH